MADVADLEPHQVTSPELAVDTQVEQRKLSDAVLHLQADAQRPDDNRVRER